MLRLRTLLPAFLLLATCATTHAQLTPQTFLPPPTLRPALKPGIMMLATAKKTAAPAGCDPAGEISQKGSVTQVDLKVTEEPNTMYNPGAGNGQYMDTVRLRSYGGCLTGPLIDLKPGTTLRVHLDNGLDPEDPSCGTEDPGCFNTINLHYHGLHVSPAGNSDNVLLNIAPRTAFDYEVNIPEDHPSGTFWYHAHRHGSTAIQVASGASGVLIIRGHRPYTGTDAGDVDTILKDAQGVAIPETVMLFQQIPYACFTTASPGHKATIMQTINGTWVCPKGKVGVVEDFNSQLSSATVWDTSGRFTSINGAVQPVLPRIKAGAIQRWRMIHGGVHDTINVQIVAMRANGANAALALKGIFKGSPAEQAKTLAEVCPITVPDSAPPVELVPQFEIAADGLTRSAIMPLGLNQKSISGLGSNFMQPGYRSDVLVAFPHKGTYCVLNQAATPKERASAGAGGQGPNTTQLLATVEVEDGTPMPADSKAYIEESLYKGNQGTPGLPVAALEALRKGDLTPWKGMPDPPPTSNFANPLNVNFFIGNLPQTPGTAPSGAFGFYLNGKTYDPNRVDFTRQVGATEDWLLTSGGEPHIYHIHVNPFQVVDVLYAPAGATPKSIFGPNGECLVKPDSVGLENQYCHLWHTFKDTVFVQNDYQVRIRTTYDRYIGTFVIHCHILDHEDGGMMTNVEIVPDLGAPGGGLGMPPMKPMKMDH